MHEVVVLLAQIVKVFLGKLYELAVCPCFPIVLREVALLEEGVRVND
jgi:hypothetical protein